MSTVFICRHFGCLTGEDWDDLLATHPLDCGQKREFGEKQEKYFKGKVVTFTVQSLIPYQYPVDLLSFFFYEKGSK